MRRDLILLQDQVKYLSLKTTHAEQAAKARQDEAERHRQTATERQILLDVANEQITAQTVQIAALHAELLAAKVPVNNNKTQAASVVAEVIADVPGQGAF